MTRTSSRGKIALLLLLALLAAPWPAWAGSPQPAGPGSTVLWRHVWGMLASLWNEIGCNIDPDGCAAATTSPALAGSGDIGCHINPDGGCARATTIPPVPGRGDIGCNIDPDGGCAK